MGKSDVIGSVGFMLCWYMKPMYIDLVLPDNTMGWKQDWFYLDNLAPVLPTRSGYAGNRCPQAAAEGPGEVEDRGADQW
jgi:hypothetical protein